MPNKPSRIRRSGPRQTTTERGYGWQWQKLRLIVLAEEPLCRFCWEMDGIATSATEVDHIDGDSHNNDRENLRPLCHTCHLQRTARDQAFGNVMWRPDWLKPSTIPLTIVCGAPASGKSLYVHQHRAVSDLVIDLDVIAAGMAASTLHGWDRARYLRPAIRQRNEMLGDLGRATARWPRAWFIISEPKADHRGWWQDQLQPERIVVIETPPAICMQRVRDDALRKKERTYEAISKWWSEYERRDGDETVTGL